MTTATQKISSGYKQTEIGVIPTDWDVKRLGDIVQFNNGKAHERFIDDKGDYIVVNSKFISTAGEVFKNSFENLSPLSAGDIAMVMSDIPNGKALAKCFFVEKDGKYTLNQRICAFKSNGSDSLYLFYKLNRNKYFLDFDGGVGQTNLKKSEVLGCPVALPSDKKEQTSIATALFDVDTLIRKLEKLIEKKKNIKHGVMQELLTGKRRLPGFSDDWKILKLRDVAVFRRGSFPQPYGLSKWYDDYFGAPFIQVFDVDDNMKVKEETKRKISKEAQEMSVFVKSGSVILTIQGSIGRIAITNYDAYMDRTLLLFESFLVPIDKYFFAYVVFVLFEIEKEKAPGGIIKTITKERLSDFLISLPTLPEQTAIAKILFDIDAEIEKLESQLTKYQNIKQGMMQTLLTGKIRLLTK